MTPRRKKTYRHHSRCYLCTPHKFTGKPRISTVRKLQVGKLERRPQPDPVRVNNEFYPYGVEADD